MDMENVDNRSYMYSLPDEIIVMILQNCMPRDIVNFSATCKQYYKVVMNCNPLWKYQCLTTFPSVLNEVIENSCNGSWLGELKRYYELKQKILGDVKAMSPKYYWTERPVNYVSITSLLNYITTPNKYLYAIHILQDLIETGNKLCNKNKCIRPYTLTDMFYAKILLQHLMHTYLAVKWTKAKMEQNLPAKAVVNFFLQWVDPAKLHLDKAADQKINVLVKEVNAILKALKKPNRECSGMQIINAVSQVMYKQRRTVITAASDLNTLDICKTIDNKCGNVVVVAAIYQAVAARCGVSCELLVFPHHLFLEWKDQDSPGKESFNIDLASGKLYQKRQCPFASSQPNRQPKFSYSPDSLLDYIYSSYYITTGALQNWNSQNAMLLLGFLAYENGEASLKNNPYRGYYTYLVENVETLINSGTPDLSQLTNEHLQIIASLANVNKIDEMPNKPFQKVVKKHTGCVKFAVGMICYHKTYEYVCVVRGWELRPNQIHYPLDGLYFGRNQPYYNITAADQSKRYVAQENLMEVTHPTRLYHLEYQLAKDFTHFDGFAYIPNDEKRSEYPEDEKIVDVFRDLCRDKPNNI